MKVTLTFLGTGTSTGMPVIGCRCAACTSRDVRDKRLRTSALVRYRHLNLLIDPGPDFRYQMLRAGTPHIDAVLITHSHYDHVGGIDDMRPYCAARHGAMPVYCTADVAQDLRNRVPYCFAEHLYPGVPTFDLHIIEGGKAFEIAPDIEVQAVPVLHGHKPIVGFRFGPLAYITDCSTLGPGAQAMLGNLDVLVVNALRLRPHFSHMSLGEALSLIETLHPHRAYLIHLSHDMGSHHQARKLLPAGVDIAVDTQTIVASSPS